MAALSCGCFKRYGGLATGYSDRRHSRGTRVDCRHIANETRPIDAMISVKSMHGVCSALERGKVAMILVWMDAGQGSSTGGVILWAVLILVAAAFAWGFLGEAARLAPGLWRSVLRPTWCVLTGELWSSGPMTDVQARSLFAAVNVSKWIAIRACGICCLAVIIVCDRPGEVIIALLVGVVSYSVAVNWLAARRVGRARSASRIDRR